MCMVGFDVFFSSYIKYGLKFFYVVGKFRERLYLGILFIYCKILLMC